MADLSDIMDLLEQLSTAAVYPSGTSQASITGTPVSIGQGWPLARDLDATMKSGQSLVSIYHEPSSTSPNDTPINSYYTAQAPTPGLTMVVTDPTITLGGNPAPPDAVAVVLNGKVYSYSVVAGDTPASVAAALRGLVLGDFPDATVQGTALTVASAYRVFGGVSGYGKVAHKIHRQRMQFQIVVWSPDPVVRNKIGAAIDVAIKRQVRQSLPDTTSAILSYQGTNLRDRDENEGTFRRDILVNVTYETIELIDTQSVIATQFSTGT